MQVAGQVAVEGVRRSRRYSASGAALHHGPASAPPNTRLKLAAPVVNKSGGRPEARCSRMPFVNIPAGRRSLSAIR